MKDKNGNAVTNVFQKLLDESSRKPNKIWVEWSSEFYNRSMKLWLYGNGIEMYSTHNKENCVLERFIRTLKKKNYKRMTTVSKNMYINKLDEIVDNYNKTFYRNEKMKTVDVQPGTYMSVYQASSSINFLF